MYIRVHVVAGAKKERVVKIQDTEFRIAVKEPAQRNMANKRIQEILAKECNVSFAKVKIVAGHHSPSKMYSIDV